MTTTQNKTIASPSLGRHLSNVANPVGQNLGITMSLEEWKYHLAWINRNVIGPPQATDHYTQEELQRMGMVGIYAPPAAVQDEKGQP